MILFNILSKSDCVFSIVTSFRSLSGVPCDMGKILILFLYAEKENCSTNCYFKSMMEEAAKLPINDRLELQNDILKPVVNKVSANRKTLAINVNF